MSHSRHLSMLVTWLLIAAIGVAPYAVAMRTLAQVHEEAASRDGCKTEERFAAASSTLHDRAGILTKSASGDEFCWKKAVAVIFVGDGEQDEKPAAPCDIEWIADHAPNMGSLQQFCVRWQV